MNGLDQRSYAMMKRPLLPVGAPAEGSAVPNRTYRVTEIVGTSDESVDAAIRNGISRVVQSVRHVDWFEVTEIRGNVYEGEVAHLQVGMKVGFRLEDE